MIAPLFPARPRAASPTSGEWANQRYPGSRRVANQRPAAGRARRAAHRSLGGGVDVARERRDDALRHVLAHPAPRAHQY